MTIDCKLIKKYARVCDRFKDTNQPIFDSIYLDFENEKASFGSNKGFGTISMPVTGYDGTQKPFLVNLTSFLALLGEFSVFEVDGFTFRAEGNEFELAHLENDASCYPSFEPTANAVDFKFSKEVIDTIKRAGAFTEEGGSESLNGVFIVSGSVVGMTMIRLFEEEVQSLKGVSMNLPRAVWETICMEVLGENLKIDNANPNGFLISNGDEITCVLPSNKSLNLPAIHSPNFAEKYNHESVIEVSKEELLKITSFMSPFVATAASTRMQVIINDNELELKTEDNNQRVSRKIPLTYSTPNVFEGRPVWMNNAWFKTILGSLSGNSLTIQIDPNKPAMNFFTKEHPETHIVTSRLTEA